MTEWKEYKLGEIADVQTGPFGSQLHMSDYQKEGTPIITVEHLGDNRIVHNNLPLVGEEDKNRLKKYVLAEGDIVFSRVGSVDRRAYVSANEDGWMFSGRCLRVRPTQKVDAKFLSYYFGLEDFKETIRRIAVGATMPSINTTILSNVIVPLPPIDIQRRIAAILSSLDDKIDLLHRENATLEQMAETLFRQWFVVEAKEEWEEGKLGDICNYVNEKIDIDNVETGDYISTENMCPNKQGVVLASSVPENGKATKYRIDDVLLSNIRPYFKKIWLSDREGGCSADVLCIRGKNELYAFFSYYTVRQDEFFDYVMLGSKGCKMPRGDKSHIMNWPITIPPKDELLKFNEIAKQGITKIRNNNNQIQTLIQTRDGLLPKLMSNEINVK